MNHRNGYSIYPKTLTVIGSLRTKIMVPLGAIRYLTPFSAVIGSVSHCSCLHTMTP